MTSVFRIATRALCLGLFAALSLVLVVTFKGIHKDVLVTFKPADQKIQLASGTDQPAPPVQLAQAESDSRLDAPANIRSALGQEPGQFVANRHRTEVALSTSDALPSAPVQMPQLPPLPGEAQEKDFEELPRTPEVETLEPPPEEAVPKEFSVATNEATNPSPSIEVPDVDQATVAEPMAGTPPVLKPAEPAAAVDNGLADRVSALQGQLEKLLAEQEKQRIAQQSWIESAQLMQQQKLQRQMRGLEETIRELKTKAEQPPSPAPIPLQSPPPSKPVANEAVVSAAPVVREERPGIDGEKRFSIESQGGVRELLNALTQKANLNLILSINVEGDVEMSLQNATADEALRAIEKSTGYVVEKNGQKVYVHPSQPVMHQREVFLPPIVRSPSRTRVVR